MKNLEDAGSETIRELEEKNEVLLEAHKEIMLQLAKKYQEAQEASFDSLTGLMRRGPFEEEIKIRLADPEIKSVALIIFDIDHFKNVNDSYGHDIGDVVLKRVAAVIGSYIRGYDPTCRWGGEEMALAMIGADEDQAELKANFIREKIEQIDFSDIDRLKDFKITVSVGVATSRKFPEFDQLLNAADQALYASKHSDRNKVTAYSKLPEVEVS
ncbi:MAG: GGDEF domain-containing protein [Patescibacteria group bacterium]